jgi:phosphate transport system substrate-binding protein
VAVYTRIIFALTLLAVGCTGFADQTGLHWTGCDVSKNAYISDVANAYAQQTGIPVNLHPGNSSSGIRDVQTGAADLGGTSRYLLPDDPREAGVELVPVAWDAVAFIVHKDNPVMDISLDQIKAIYTGKIKNWSSLGGPDQQIEVFAYKNKDSGAGQSLRELLFSDTSQHLPASRVFDSSSELEQAVIENPNAIAFTGISNARLGDFRIVSLDSVEPTVDNIKSGTYGLYRPLYLAYDPASPNLESIKDFISYVNSKTGREIMYSNGVVPYREAISLVMKKVRDNEATYPQLVDKNE